MAGRYIYDVYSNNGDPSGRMDQGVGLRPLAYWNCGFESCRRHENLSVVSITCCQVESPASSRSLFQRSPKECDASILM
jgi:hypothetical protein